MRIPKNLTGKDLIKALGAFGYSVTRQVGSHIRLTTQQNGIHHITMPNHKPLKVGTLSSILKSIANHFDISKEDLVDKLFNN